VAKDRQMEDKAMYESRTWAAGCRVAMEGDAIYCSDSPAAHRGPGQVDMEVLGLQNDQRRDKKSSEHCDMGIGLMCLLSTQRKDS